jgi:hypothetical protein
MMAMGEPTENSRGIHPSVLDPKRISPEGTKKAFFRR